MKHGLSALILLIVVVLAFAGGSRAQLSRYENPIKWDQYMAAEYCGIDKTTTQVINNEAEWQTFWAKLSGQGAQTAPKDVDWNKYVLMAITLGTKPTPGYSVYVESVERTRAYEYVVHYVEWQPQPGQLLAQVTTSPFVIIRVEKTTGTPQFVGRTATQRVFSQPKTLCGCRCGCGSCRCAH
jgi:hypothetical protein